LLLYLIDKRLDNKARLSRISRDTISLLLIRLNRSLVSKRRGILKELNKKPVNISREIKKRKVGVIKKGF
jgi:hypothetical protein